MHAGWVGVEMAGERLWLGPQRALFWPRRRTLVIADPHFGKGGVFRRAGVAVPQGDTARDLARLGGVIALCAAERLVILGDMLHAPPRGDEPWLASFARWRCEHEALAVDVVRGNHDRQWQSPPEWRLHWHAGTLPEAPFRFSHEPREPDEPCAHFTLAGHLHPVVRLGTRGDRLRLPALWVREHGAVAPAFGGFTGGHPVRPQTGERLYLITPDAVVPYAPAAAAPSRRAPEPGPRRR